MVRQCSMTKEILSGPFQPCRLRCPHQRKLYVIAFHDTLSQFITHVIYVHSSGFKDVLINGGK